MSNWWAWSLILLPVPPVVLIFRWYFTRRFQLFSATCSTVGCLHLRAFDLMTLYTRLVKVTVPRAQGYTLQASSAHVKNSCVHLYGKYYFHFFIWKTFRRYESASSFQLNFFQYRQCLHNISWQSEVLVLSGSLIAPNGSSCFSGGMFATTKCKSQYLASSKWQNPMEPFLVILS